MYPYINTFLLLKSLKLCKKQMCPIMCKAVELVCGHCEKRRRQKVGAWVFSSGHGGQD